MGLGVGLHTLQTQIGFEKVTKVKGLLPILEERLPKSCNIYNMAKSNHKFQIEMSFYLLRFNSELSHSDHWIVATYAREDYGLDVNISGPADLANSSEFKDALISSGIIRWNQPFIFAATDSDLCPVIEELVEEATGKKSSHSKNIMFYTTPDFHPKLMTQFKLEGSRVELKPLDSQVGAKFLVDNWPFAKGGSLTYVRKLIERNRSSGVYIDGKLVAGAALNGSGMITMLYTLLEHRHKGYAQLCMSYFVQTLFKDNLVPCCTVQVSNSASLALQRKIGLQVSHEAVYISRS